MNKRTLRIILGDRAIAYHPYLAKAMGSVAGGVWLSQLLYWDSVKATTTEDDSECWFYKTDSEIIGETCLSIREAREAKKTAKEKKLVKTELRGMPARTHYFIDFDELERLITCSYNGVEQVGTMASNKLVRRCTNKLVQIHAQNLPQSTHESTHESTLPPTSEKQIINSPHPGKAPESVPTVQAKTRIEKAVSEYTGRQLAKSDARAAERAFINEVAPRFAEVLRHEYPTSTDKQAARKIYGKYDRDWLDNQLSRYANGHGEKFRADDATAFWITNDLDEQYAKRDNDDWNDLSKFVKVT